MDKNNKRELFEAVERQKEQLLKYIGPAYEELVKEKEALEDNLKALTIKMNKIEESGETSTPKSATSTEVKKEQRKPETVSQLKTQLGVLMTSLATLSAEKSKMEANFQSDKRQLRSEREECEKVIRDLKEKLKKAQKDIHSEVEHVKYKLIMERHEREKEQADHSAMMKELQRLVSDERRAKEQLEMQVKELKSQVSGKSQRRILEAELEIARNKLKEAEAAAKETPPLLLSLQAEMATLKRQHRNAILEEQKRAGAAEQQARVLAMTHEARVAGLEARLAELSETVGGYDRLRQQDQQAIQKLKDQLANLREKDQKEPQLTELNIDPQEIIGKIKKLYSRLLDCDNKGNGSSHAKALLHSLNLYDSNQDLEYKEKYESLSLEFEDYKQQTTSKLNALTSARMQSARYHASNMMESNERENNNTQLHLAKTHNRNLEERIRMLNAEIAGKERECKAKLEQQQQLIQDERIKHERILSQKDNEYRGKIAALEQQLLRQRERSLAVIEEKDQEIVTLKTSFHALLPNKGSSFSSEEKSTSSSLENASEPTTDLVTGLLTGDSPPMLHYAQELARREVQVSALRKANMKLEEQLRENQRDFFHAVEKHKDELKGLQAQITRLEACKSREGANLEYLKNVFVNFLITNDSSSKRHMLNAISTVLHFTPDEMDKIRHYKW
ncbi:GRIP and coiled-coil domain-containing protein 1 isoform X2 [Cephus cinctus]|uniref:GRIP and coiled-coil domain-containing protein 1 isoform X2 n=1 Tax=Cephus cinctus TaxID=211228 RepID=A0AAJ7RVY8_CEPCN|nr:GRIP and coiled-coil domain-containing protein 1 isoform X2 [Cephus cinctus]